MHHVGPLPRHVLPAALLAAALAAGCGEGPELVAGEGLLVLRGATLIDGRGGEPVGASVVAIEDGRIVAVGTDGDFRFPADARIVDVAGRFLLPGLADVHSHVAQPADDNDAGRPWDDSSEAALREQLALGITTIRNPAGPTEVAVALRDAVAAGEIPGPRIFTAGRLIDDPTSVNPILRRNNLAAWSEDHFARAKRTWPKVLDFARLLHDRGVTVLAGSDLPAPATFHRELELLVSAGIPSIEVLGIATRNAAQALGIGAESGTIEVGKNADMVVLAGDPVADIRHTRDVVMVVQAGRVLDLDALAP